jgi:hypothetical protein
MDAIPCAYPVAPVFHRPSGSTRACVWEGIRFDTPSFISCEAYYMRVIVEEDMDVMLHFRNVVRSILTPNILRDHTYCVCNPVT